MPGFPLAAIDSTWRMVSVLSLQAKSEKNGPGSPRVDSQKSTKSTVRHSGTSRSSRPDSTNRSAAIAEIGLLTEAMLLGVSGVIGMWRSRSAKP